VVCFRSIAACVGVPESHVPVVGAIHVAIDEPRIGELAGSL
jgi:hypothetical protein